MKTLKTTIAILVISQLLYGCVGIPEGIEPVDDFQLDRYLGTWYEIARLDHSFERGLDRVTAEYSLREDGGVRVINRGYSVSEGQWKEAEGNLAPLGTKRAGIFLAGAGIGPKDIPEAVSQGSGAAGKVLSLFKQWGGPPAVE